MIKKLQKIYRRAAIAIFALAVVTAGAFVIIGIRTKKSTAAKIETAAVVASDTSAQQTTTAINQLIINKISVNAPISMSIDGNNKVSYDKALEAGVVHLKGTGLPGEYGNTFIFGHSSFYADKPGNYKQIFAGLNDLENGDNIEIQTSSKHYIYRVTAKKIIEPTDVSVANQDMSKKKLTLMTCWPIGSTAKRLVVIGNLVE